MDLVCIVLGFFDRILLLLQSLCEKLRRDVSLSLDLILEKHSHLGNGGLDVGIPLLLQLLLKLQRRDQFSLHLIDVFDQISDYLVFVVGHELRELFLLEGKE